MVMCSHARWMVRIALASAIGVLLALPGSAPSAAAPGAPNQGHSGSQGQPGDQGQSVNQEQPGDQEFLAFMPAAYRPAKPPPADEGMMYGGENVPAQGDPAAPLTIWMFSDYMCPYCAKLARQTVPGLRANYVAKGKARMAFVDFNIPDHGEISLVSHEAAHCAREQGRYFDMHDEIFQYQDDLYYNTYPRYDPDTCRTALTQHAVNIGLDGDLMRSCLDSEKYRPMISRLFGIARSIDGIYGTPTMVIESALGKRNLVGFYSYLEMEEILDRELARLGATPAPQLSGRASR